MTHTSAVRWGILGVAKIAMKAFVPGIAGAANAELVAVASRDGDKAAAAAAEIGIDRSYGSYAELLADPDVDAVYNPMPNHLHAEWSIKAMEAGKHVLCEKPLAMNAAVAEEMAAASERTGKLLMEAFMYRFHPQWQTVRQLIADGRIGTVQAVRSWFHYPPNPKTNVRYVPEYGGGGLLDVGCYCIDSARMIFGEDPVAATGRLTIDDETGVDVLAAGLLEFSTGYAVFTAGMEQDLAQQVHITGTEGQIAVPRAFNPWPDRPSVVVLRRPDGDETVEIPVTNQFTLEIEAFSQAVLDGAAEPPVPLSNALANMRVLDALRNQ